MTKRTANTRSQHKKRRALIHLGMSKTGTTSIQAAVRGYDDGRVAASCLPELQNPAFALLFGTQANRQWQGRLCDQSENSLSMLEERYRGFFNVDLARRDRDILWSCEILSRAKSAATMAENLSAALRTDFDRLEGIAYVRPPSQWVVSQLHQCLRFNEAPNTIAELWPSYWASLAPWKTHLDEVTIRLFDKPALFKGDVVEDFAKALRLGPLSQVPRLNAGFGAVQTALIYLLVRNAPDFLKGDPNGRMLGRLASALAELDVRKLLIDSEALTEVMQPNLDDLRWVADQMPEHSSTFLSTKTQKDHNSISIRDFPDLIEIARADGMDALKDWPRSRRIFSDPADSLIDAMQTFIRLSAPFNHQDGSHSPHLFSLAGAQVTDWRAKIGLDAFPDRRAVGKDAAPQVAILLDDPAAGAPGRMVAATHFRSANIGVELLVVYSHENRDAICEPHVATSWLSLAKDATVREKLTAAAEASEATWLLACLEAPPPILSQLQQALDRNTADHRADLIVFGKSPIWSARLDAMLIRRSSLAKLLERVSDELDAYELAASLVSASADRIAMVVEGGPSQTNAYVEPSCIAVKTRAPLISPELDRLTQILERLTETQTSSETQINPCFYLLPHPQSVPAHAAEEVRRARLAWALDHLAGKDRRPGLAKLADPFKADQPRLMRLGGCQVLHVNWRGAPAPGPGEIKVVLPQGAVALPFVLWREQLFVILSDHIRQKVWQAGTPGRLFMPPRDGKSVVPLMLRAIENHARTELDIMEAAF